MSRPQGSENQSEFWKSFLLRRRQYGGAPSGNTEERPMQINVGMIEIPTISSLMDRLELQPTEEIKKDDQSLVEKNAALEMDEEVEDSEEEDQILSEKDDPRRENGNKTEMDGDAEDNDEDDQSLYEKNDPRRKNRGKPNLEEKVEDSDEDDQSLYEKDDPRRKNRRYGRNGEDDQSLFEKEPINADNEEVENNEAKKEEEKLSDSSPSTSDGRTNTSEDKNKKKKPAQPLRPITGPAKTPKKIRYEEGMFPPKQRNRKPKAKKPSKPKKMTEHRRKMEKIEFEKEIEKEVRMAIRDHAEDTVIQFHHNPNLLNEDDWFQKEYFQGILTRLINEQLSENFVGNAFNDVVQAYMVLDDTCFNFRKFMVYSVTVKDREERLQMERTMMLHFYRVFVKEEVLDCYMEKEYASIMEYVEDYYKDKNISNNTTRHLAHAYLKKSIENYSNNREDWGGLKMGIISQLIDIHFNFPEVFQASLSILKRPADLSPKDRYEETFYWCEMLTYFRDTECYTTVNYVL